MFRLVSVLSLAAVALSACGNGAPKAAAESASQLLEAVQKRDKAAFEAGIDRNALRADVRRQVAEVARPTALDVDGGPSEFALDRMIGPDAIRLADPGAPPSTAEMAERLKVIDANHVCLRDHQTPDRCALTFGKAGGRWRLVGMKAIDLPIMIAGA